MFKNFKAKFKVQALYGSLFIFTYLIIISLLGFVGFNNYISATTGLIVYLIIFLSLHGFFTYKQRNALLKIDEKPELGKLEFIKSYVYIRFLSLWAILGMLSFFFIYHNDIAPAQMPAYSLYNATNGKEIYFQSMIHIGKDKFYNEINEKIESYSNSGYVLYFEGVSDLGDEQGDSSANERLNDKIGISISPSLYENIGSAIGADIRGQDNSEMIQRAKKVVNADVSIQELLGEEKSGTGTVSGEVVVMNTGSVSNTVDNTVQPEGNKEQQLLADTIKSISEKQTFSFMFRGMLNFTMKNPQVSNWVLKAQGDNGDFFQERILNFRNTKLAEKVLDGGDKKIFITYGMAHFPGFLEELNRISKERGEGEYVLIKTEYNKPF